VLATGQPDGAYDTFGREYQRRLAREGLRVEIRSTAGSLENLDRLLRADVDVAFVQGGTTRSWRIRAACCGGWRRCTGIWRPPFKIHPWLIRWRGNRILERHYALLRDAEAVVASAGRPEPLRDGIARLEALRSQIEGLARRLSLQHQRDVYHCRLHVSLVLTESPRPPPPLRGSPDPLARLRGGGLLKKVQM
jgi:hypothetical protein